MCRTLLSGVSDLPFFEVRGLVTCRFMPGMMGGVLLTFLLSCMLRICSAACSASRAQRHGRRWSSNPSGIFPHERPTRGTVCATMRSMCGADAGCLAINYQSLDIWVARTQNLRTHAGFGACVQGYLAHKKYPPPRTLQ